MSGRVLIGIGLVCIVLGGVWTLQGIGVIGGSFMTGSGALLVVGLGGAVARGLLPLGGAPPARRRPVPSPPPPRPLRRRRGPAP